MRPADEPVPAKLLFRDHDTKFVPEFDDVFASDGVVVRPVGPVAPNMNAYAERWVQSVKGECLDRFVVFGMDHLRHLISEYLAHYHAERPHQGLGKMSTSPTPDKSVFDQQIVRCPPRQSFYNGRPAPEGLETLVTTRHGGLAVNMDWPSRRNDAGYLLPGALVQRRKTSRSSFSRPRKRPRSERVSCNLRCKTCSR
jgi:hypothetical protein